VVGFKSPLIIFGENVNFAVYVESLIKTGFMRLANVMFGECHWHSVEDGASCYTSTQCLDLCLRSVMYRVSGDD
jgi:hypothetical protein